MRLSPLALAGAAWISTLAAQDPVHHLAHVTAVDADALQRLLALDVDLASCSHAAAGGDVRFPKRLDVVVTDDDLRRLRDAGFRSVVMIPRLEEHYARTAAQHGPYPEGPTPPLGQGAMGGHWTLAQMEAILDQLHQQNPAIVSARASIGQSIEQRDLWMVKISDNVGVDENEPEALFDALHHAREPLSMETTLVFMSWLVDNYGTDPVATFLVDERELFFVPCVNPDGYEYNRQTNPGGGGLWRKNRRNNGDGTFGVDLNRNYSIGWNAPFGGNSTNTSSATYRGPSAFSEPESAAIDALCQQRTFTQVFSVHTYTDVLLSPWGYQPGLPANRSEYIALGEAMTRDNGIEFGSGFDVLYAGAGVATDYHHQVHGSYAWTPELGRQDEGGFWPSGQRILDIATRHQPMFRTMALTAGAWLELGDIAVGEAPGGNGNGRIEPGETGRIGVTVENRGVRPTTGAVGVAVTILSSGVAAGTAQLALPAAPAFGQSASTSSFLTFTLPTSYASRVLDVRFTVTGDGGSWSVDRRLPLGPSRIVVDDDLERARGFALDAASTATTGNWTRGAPQQTSSGGTVIQPGQQTTPGGQACWVTDFRAGSSVGANDVDDGYTDLVSPVLDLQHLDLVELVFERWYGESQANDAFELAVSDDGGQSWTSLLRDSNPTGAWVEETIVLPAPLTASMQLRFRARDDNPSLVEAAIDDLRIRGVGDDGALTMLGSGELGTWVRLGTIGTPGATVLLLASSGANGNLTVPGVSGTFRLELATLVTLPSLTIGSDGSEALDAPIPNVATLIGTTVHFQSAHVAATSARFGNTQSVTIR